MPFNYDPVFYTFSHIARYWSKIVKFICTTCMQRLHRGWLRRSFAKCLPPRTIEKCNYLLTYLLNVLEKLEWWATMGAIKYDDFKFSMPWPAICRCNVFSLLDVNVVTLRSFATILGFLLVQTILHWSSRWHILTMLCSRVLLFVCLSQVYNMWWWQC